MSEAIISAKDVHYQYEDAENAAVNGVALDVPAGEFLAVLGRNGSGKSTFAKLLNALLIPTSGTVTVDGRRATGEDDCFPVREVCGMVFQNPDNQIVATTVEEDCALVRRTSASARGNPPARRRDARRRRHGELPSARRRCSPAGRSSASRSLACW